VAPKPEPVSKDADKKAAQKLLEKAAAERKRRAELPGCLSETEG